jgi:hypothetical protein
VVFGKNKALVNLSISISNSLPNKHTVTIQKIIDYPQESNNHAFFLLFLLSSIFSNQQNYLYQISIVLENSKTQKRYGNKKKHG